VAQKSHLLRRPSGVYVCRIVVPLRHRQTIGKSEIHQSTNTRDLPIAKLVSASVLAHWREKFLTLDRLMTDVKRLLEGSPLLSLNGHISVASAAELSGLTTSDILKNALEGRWGLFYRSGGSGVTTHWNGVGGVANSISCRGFDCGRSVAVGGRDARRQGGVLRPAWTAHPPGWWRRSISQPLL
jgi:hypothetical protein